MYIPDNMAMKDCQAAYNFIKHYSFGVLVSPSLHASHLPFLLDDSDSDNVHLLTHLAHVNNHIEALDGQRVLCIFSGPHAYISPTWYAAAPAVPTWNYAAVHVYGHAELVDDKQQLQYILDQTLQFFEPSLLDQREIVTQSVQNTMSRAIIGLKINIESIKGKEKLGQLRSLADQRGVCEGLARSDRQDAAQLLVYMVKRGLGLGSPMNKE